MAIIEAVNRRHKYRAFSKESGMWDWDKLCGFKEFPPHLLSCLVSNQDGSWIVMEWTGLLDKNLKEIYEDDLVIAWSQGSKATFVIKWRQEGSPCFILYPAWQGGQMWYLHGSNDRKGNWVDDIEVIGNIHETPEKIPPTIYKSYLLPNVE